jgi:hypothetical protein
MREICMSGSVGVRGRPRATRLFDDSRARTGHMGGTPSVPASSRGATVRRRRRGAKEGRDMPSRRNTGEGGLTLGAKNLYELVANAPGDEIVLKKTDNHWAEIKSGKVTYRIVGMPDRGPRPPRGFVFSDRERDAPRNDRTHAVQRVQRRDALPPQPESTTRPCFAHRSVSSVARPSE